MPDEELVARTQKGDTDAFNEIYLKYVTPVYRYIRVRVRNPQETEDLTAEVFIKAWKAFSSYEWQGIPLITWLLRIAHNKVVDHYRKRSVDFAWLPEQLEDNRRHFLFVEQQDELVRALSSLSAEQQTILHLRFAEGFETAEIAGLLNKTANAVRVAQHRALKQLRKVMEYAQSQRQGEFARSARPAEGD